MLKNLRHYGRRLTASALPYGDSNYAEFRPDRSPTVRPGDMTLDRLVAARALSPEMAKVLQILVQSRLNILISGDQKSGKSSLLNAMAAAAGADERIITLERKPELRLTQPHVVRLCAQTSDEQGKPEIGFAPLLQAALHMRPDRLFLGETQGGETPCLLEALNNGIDGLIAIIQAPSPRWALLALETRARDQQAHVTPQAMRQYIASAFDIIVQTGVMADGVRRVTHIVEIAGTQEDTIALHPFFVCETTQEYPFFAFKNNGVKPRSGLRKAAQYGLDKELLAALG